MVLFIDPDFEFVFVHRLLFSLNNPGLWDEDLMPRQNKYVIFGQSTCQKKEAVIFLLKKHMVKYQIKKLKENQIVYPNIYTQTQVVIIDNGHYLPLHPDVIKNDAYIYIVLNDVPPNDRKNTPMFWKDNFDYKLSYNTPDKTTAKEMFINLIKKFNSDNINIDDEGFDLLAKSAEFCTFKDIQKFCQRLFYDTTYNSDLKIDIKSLKLNYLFIDGQTGNYLLEKETYDKDPKRQIQPH